jgi:hypothetical protein
MKQLHFLFFITNIYSINTCFITNQYKPICSNCKFFIPYQDTCSKFGEKNLISGKYTYEKANNVRNDEEKCGEYAIFYEKNNAKPITDSYYFLSKNKINILLIAYGFTPLIMWYISTIEH